MEGLRDLICKIGIKKMGGSSLESGVLYHDIPFMPNIPSYRGNTRMRVDKILKELDVKNKEGLDLGCAVGGITFRLQAAGADMVGLDYDEANIDFANALENYYKTGAKFYHTTITDELISGFRQYDFIVWLDQWMWLLKQTGLDNACKAIATVSQKTDCLFFSTDQGDAMAKSANISSKDDVLKILRDNTDYQLDDLGTVNDGWFPRNIFRCYR